MSFFGSNKKDEAKIHETEWNGKTTQSSNFKTVTNANNALGHIIAAEGMIVLEESVNDDEGRVIQGLRKIGNSKLWGETEYEVKKADGSIQP